MCWAWVDRADVARVRSRDAVSRAPPGFCRGRVYGSGFWSVVGAVGVWLVFALYAQRLAAVFAVF